MLTKVVVKDALGRLRQSRKADCKQAVRDTCLLFDTRCESRPSKLFELRGGADIGEFLLNRLGFFLGHAFLDGFGSTFY
jgi:hypothetical protein